MTHFCVIPELYTFQLVFLPLQMPDSNTQFRALAVVRKRSFGEPHWSSFCPYGAPNRVKLLAHSSLTELAISSLLHRSTHKAAKDKSDQQCYWMPAIHGELLTLTVSPCSKRQLLHTCIPRLNRCLHPCTELHTSGEGQERLTILLCNSDTWVSPYFHCTAKIKNWKSPFWVFSCAAILKSG